MRPLDGLSSTSDRMYPYLAQEDLLEFCRGKGIHVIAYSPTGKGSVTAAGAGG